MTPRAAYEAKQLHRVPDAPVVSREEFLLERCAGKLVLDIGASGPMHDAIVKVAKECWGLDRVSGPKVIACDLDDDLPNIPWDSSYAAPEIIVCGEVLEHLSNPGRFLGKLRSAYPSVLVVITVPNAFSDAARKHLANGIECVNLDHVCYYSYTTLKELVSRSGYAIRSWRWYNGKPMFAEGLIFVCE